MTAVLGALGALGAASPVGSVAGRTRPVTLAGEQLLPVLAPLAELLPGGGLRRGSVVVVPAGSVSGVSGATSLALALMAAVSQAGSWCAAVGLPGLGLVAAAELGIALERFALVPDPAEQWPVVTAALIDAVDVVLVRPSRRVWPADARRLRARARERGTVLVPCGGSWPEGADLRMVVARSGWQGLGQGDGSLRARLVEVVASGRGAAAREHRIQLWLPGLDGAVAACEGSDRLAAEGLAADELAAEGLAVDELAADERLAVG
ncbi:MAG TPA: hypothetical protein VLL25_09365 [Acidimicrobiales bacterium]|nr:hypothetical protein [Acidimicrobiales bacterium]